MIGASERLAVLGKGISFVTKPANLSDPQAHMVEGRSQLVLCPAPWHVCVCTCTSHIQEI